MGHLAGCGTVLSVQAASRWGPPHCIGPGGMGSDLLAVALMRVKCGNMLHQWLCAVLQVNASPSMTSTTAADRLLKWTVVHDTLSVVIPADTMRPGSSSNNSSRCATAASPIKTPSKKGAAHQQQCHYPPAVGCMQLIHHDDLEAGAKRRKPGKRAQHAAADAVTGSPMAAVHKHVVLHG